MQTSDFIPEREACDVTGVSPRTLQRFAEAGYLQLEKDIDGLCKFSKRELEALFGVKAEESDETPSEISVADIDLEKPSVEPEPYQESSALATEVEVLRSPEAQISAAEQPSPKAPSQERLTSGIELETLKNLVKIQEKLLDARDDEISDLKEQRDWLKQRIEKLEQKAERDQLLLLSEAQTVKSLVALQHSKKSPVRLALEYFGFVQASEKQAAQ